METFVHSFKGFGRVPSTCTVHIMRENGNVYVGFEDDNNGTSVTNASEQIATEVVKLKNLNPEDCLFFEWYPQYDGEVSLIEYTWSSDKAASHPNWKYWCEKEKNPFV